MQFLARPCYFTKLYQRRRIINMHIPQVASKIISNMNDDRIIVTPFFHH